MPGKILIVDSIATNRIVLKVRLSNAFYKVIQAADPNEADVILQNEAIDLVMVNAHLESADAIAFCRRLKTGPKTSHLPILVISSQHDREMRLAALKAGANDVLVRPIDDVFLFARLRSLLRSLETAEESELRQKTGQAMGFAETTTSFVAQSQIHVTTPESATSIRWATVLKTMMPYRITPTIHSDTLKHLSGSKVPDVFVIAVDRQKPDTALRLIAEIRARASTRHSGILVVVDDERRRILVDAMDLGAHDVMMNGFDPDEMSLRISTLASQKRLSDRLRDNVTIGLDAAVTDPLTGLFNRRYALPHVERLCSRAKLKKQQFAIMIADLDHFKQVNDQFGHATGDAVLTEAARRLREHLRPVDLVARIGGEEFLIAMPETTPERANRMALDMCSVMRERPVQVSSINKRISVTMSIGVTMGGCGHLTKPVNALIEQADSALYDAKLRGRDQVRFAKEHA
ncbi:diguanylate cyclase [Cognatishimia activa]|uniref:diguanylate cyclase n=1 Tax=Cognatishimia activa TaxID=1715691 RepID=A0A0P1IUN8_9RHOB|nr:diguanylate cyclase [Cognatishimia activa]CUI90106.1 Stalked cell differentiation-controlling protein [Cognatishimia activa]CUK25690.1 Stalked cell differentiation-controlling protein [Cognatishimia activa]